MQSKGQLKVQKIVAHIKTFPSRVERQQTHNHTVIQAHLIFIYTYNISHNSLNVACVIKTN